ncbi:hypothetical protein IL306_006455, partial [Fusarium sp. DS 682]
MPFSLSKATDWVRFFKAAYDFVIGIYRSLRKGKWVGYFQTLRQLVYEYRYRGLDENGQQLLIETLRKVQRIEWRGVVFNNAQTRVINEAEQAEQNMHARKAVKRVRRDLKEVRSHLRIEDEEESSEEEDDSSEEEEDDEEQKQPASQPQVAYSTPRPRNHRTLSLDEPRPHIYVDEGGRNYDASGQYLGPTTYEPRRLLTSQPETYTYADSRTNTISQYSQPTTLTAGHIQAPQPTIYMDARGQRYTLDEYGQPTNPNVRVPTQFP